MVWLANLANRHGRLVADVIAGLEVRARPAVKAGTAVGRMARPDEISDEAKKVMMGITKA